MLEFYILLILVGLFGFKAVCERPVLCHLTLYLICAIALKVIHLPFVLSRTLDASAGPFGPMCQPSENRGFDRCVWCGGHRERGD